jgi:hypothetical protein
MRGVLAGMMLAVLVAAGCSAPRRDASTFLGTPVRRHHHAAAPKNPDLGTEIESFYQLVEGERWSYAYAMLSPRYRATLTQAQFERRYGSLVAPDVTAQQLDSSTVVAHIVAKDRADRAHTLHLEETVKLGWNGEQWTIEKITRRRLGAASTR